MVTVIATIHVCTDCMLAHANGEAGTETPDREPWGLLPGVDVAMDFGSDDDAGSVFSWSQCQGCGTTLGGNRYRFAVFSYGS